MEKYIDLSNSEHYNLIFELAMNIDESKVKNVLDSGSGKTSLSILHKLFPKSYIDAIVFNGDERKISSIMENIVSERCTIIEMDICKEVIFKKYDVVLAHLLLGEAEKWGNSFEELFTRLVNIECEYLIILDYKEDPSIDYHYLEVVLKDKFELITQGEITKSQPQEFKRFIGKTYIAYLGKRK